MHCSKIKQILSIRITWCPCPCTRENEYTIVRRVLHTYDELRCALSLKPILLAIWCPVASFMVKFNKFSICNCSLVHCLACSMPMHCTPRHMQLPKLNMMWMAYWPNVVTQCKPRVVQICWTVHVATLLSRAAIVKRQLLGRYLL